MIERIKAALAACGVCRWRINEVTEESAELFFVKHELDQRRIKDTHKFRVTVFRTCCRDGKALTGSTAAEIVPSMDDEELRTAVGDAYYAAQFALNPDYEAPSPVKAELIEKKDALAGQPLAVSAGLMAEAIFAGEGGGKAFVNSAEVFCHRTFTRIVSSEGTDVSFTDACCRGEFVSQCREPEDVELFAQFEYDGLETAALTARVKEQLGYAEDRASAAGVLRSGKYDILLTDGNLAELFGYYLSRTSAEMIYPHYSQWKTGDRVQGETTGEGISLSLEATVPYSDDGIPLRGLNVMEDGVMTAIHGQTRFCRYLGIEPTGTYGKFSCGNKGTMSFAGMKKLNCILPVMFSDFQTDPMSGHFGGEIRLAYLLEDGRVTPITGGSINGSILDAQKNLVFSTDRYKSADYEGPRACLLRDISVAGTADNQ